MHRSSRCLRDVVCIDRWLSSWFEICGVRLLSMVPPPWQDLPFPDGDHPVPVGLQSHLPYWDSDRAKLYFGHVPTYTQWTGSSNTERLRYVSSGIINGSPLSFHYDGLDRRGSICTGRSRLVLNPDRKRHYVQFASHHITSWKKGNSNPHVYQANVPCPSQTEVLATVHIHHNVSTSRIHWHSIYWKHRYIICELFLPWNTEPYWSYT